MGMSGSPFGAQVPGTGVGSPPALPFGCSTDVDRLLPFPGCWGRSCIPSGPGPGQAPSPPMHIKGSPSVHQGGWDLVSRTPVDSLVVTNWAEGWTHRSRQVALSLAHAVSVSWALGTQDGWAAVCPGEALARGRCQSPRQSWSSCRHPEDAALAGAMFGDTQVTWVSGVTE